LLLWSSVFVHVTSTPDSLTISASQEGARGSDTCEVYEVACGACWEVLVGVKRPNACEPSCGGGERERGGGGVSYYVCASEYPCEWLGLRVCSLHVRICPLNRSLQRLFACFSERRVSSVFAEAVCVF
jgi:hypothetical protein